MLETVVINQNVIVRLNIMEKKKPKQKKNKEKDCCDEDNCECKNGHKCRCCDD